MIRRALFALFCLSLVACSAAPLSPALPEANASLRASATKSPLEHIVIVVQENRSFDNIFAGYPGANAPTFGYDSKGKKVNFQSITFKSLNPSHTWASAVADWNRGKMNMFDQGEMTANAPAGDYVYAHLKRSLVGPYWKMAKSYVLADHMFPTMFGGSFTAHLDLIAGTARISSYSSEVDYPSYAPWDCDSASGAVTSLVNVNRQVLEAEGPFPCFNTFNTMAGPLDHANVSWKYYAPSLSDSGGQLWTTFGAIKGVRYGHDWANVVSPQTQIIKDVRSGQLPGVSWVIPDWRDSDHAGSLSDTGPSWVAAIVNTIGQSEYWKNTAIVVVWDDWGGWYDNVPPPQLDYLGLGIRVPCLIVSSYAKAGYVTHRQYEYGSILKLVEETFGLPAIGKKSDGYTDARANSMLDSFDFGRAPRSFTPIPAKYPPSYFLNSPYSLRVPDEE